MNYVDPARGDKAVTVDGITHRVGYYQAPTALTGVTDESHSEYAAGTAYGVGDCCKIDELKAIYKSSAESNTGNYPPENKDKWTFWSPLNSYCMLAVDEFIGSQTTGEDMVMTFDFSNHSAFSMVGAVFESVAITIIDDVTSEVYFSETIYGSTAGAESWYEYFYGEYDLVNRVYRGGIEISSDSTLIMTFSGGASIGAVVMGRVKETGCTLMGTSLRFEDTSTIQKSEVTGFRTVTRYGNVRVLSVGVLFDTIDFNSMARKMEKIIGHNVLFVPTEEDTFSEMITIGYFEDIEIPVENSSKIKTQSTIIGVI